MKAILPVQTAVYDKLIGDTALMAAVKGVFDEVPQDHSFPYVTIGEFRSTPYKTFGRGGEKLEMALHVWSRYKGFKETLNISIHLQRLLDGTDLLPDGFDHVSTKFVSGQTFREADGITRYAQVIFEILVQEQE